jgi:TRAP-type C4-dicarboxylate transport system substrate-binding protein
MMLRPLVALLLFAGLAQAEPKWTVRMALVAPEGSGWARIFKDMGREVESRTRGEVRLKWYFGGVAGDENELEARIKKGQMDGGAAGGLCQTVSPSLRVLNIAGVFQTFEESTYVLQQLRSTMEAEAKDRGYNMLVVAALGPDVLFSRKPVRSMAELRSLRWWRWQLLDAGIMMGREMGMQIVPTSLFDAAPAYDQQKLDGFLSVPTAALVFGWSTQAHYLTDLRTGYLMGCVVIANRAMDRLPIEHQNVIHQVAQEAGVHFTESGRDLDDRLLGGLFAKQGLKVVPVSKTFRAEFFEAARLARERLGDKLVERPVLDRVLRLLADYRAEHGLATQR